MIAAAVLAHELIEGVSSAAGHNAAVVARAVGGRGRARRALVHERHAM